MKYEIETFGKENATLYIEATTEEQVETLTLIKQLLEKIENNS